MVIAYLFKKYQRILKIPGRCSHVKAHTSSAHFHINIYDYYDKQNYVLLILLLLLQ